MQPTGVTELRGGPRVRAAGAFAVALLASVLSAFPAVAQSAAETARQDQGPPAGTEPVESGDQQPPREGPPDDAGPGPESPPAGASRVWPQEPISPRSRRLPLQASWDNGLLFVSEDEQSHLHVGGVGQIDSVWLVGPQSVFALPGGGANGVGNAQATLLRRAVLQADGDLFGQFDYIIQFDFANASNENNGVQPPSFGNLTSSPAPLNIWMQIRDVPYLGNVRFGNQVKPLGLTNNTPFTFLPFMERPDIFDAFYGPFDNGYALGLSARNWAPSERLTWQFGIYRPATNVFGVALNKAEEGARVTALPLYADDGRYLVHLGLGYLGGEVVQDESEARARPLLRNAPGFAVPVLVNTGEVPASRQYTIGPEFAMVLGPLTVQAEWAGQFLTDASGPNGLPVGTVFFHGGYVEALYFLTGEYQPYLRTEGAFGRIIPRHDYRWKKGECLRGCGAWQLGVRFSYLDLNDKAIQGGRLYDWTAGLNWFLTGNMKVQFNYIAEHRDQPGAAVGWINGFGIRAAYDF
jgi:phosphate-selective porin OprO/OprP